MGDDIDDLLDEVESKYCDNNVASSSKGTSTTSKTKTAEVKPKKNSKPTSNADNLNDLIDDIMSDDGINITLNQDNVKRVNSGNNGDETGTKLKCFSVFVGGSLSPVGVATTSNQRACDRLHCTSCDNQVVTFNDFKWSEDQCDYLAFRNNYPDFSRLKSLLIPREGYRAYCCQCSWLAVKVINDLSKWSFKWICRKH